MGKNRRAGKHTKTPMAGRISLNKKEWILSFFESGIITALIAWLFYDSMIIMLSLPLFMMINTKRMAASKERKFKKSFDDEFKEMLLAVSDALSGGYSIENAFKDAGDNLRNIYGQESIMLKELNEINNKISMRIPAEQAFMEFAQKNPTEETIGFAQVFSFARRLGGDYIKNMRRTIEKMQEKIEIKQDISVAVSAKKMEFAVMCAMPLGILLYVRVSSAEFLETLYGNIPGIAIMSICLLLYGFAIFVGSKIVDIQV